MMRSLAAFLLLPAVSAPAIAIAQTDSPAVTAPAPAPATPRPNVLVWLLDDVGFAQWSSFGGLVETPNIDRVAAMGLRYSNYHTAPICSATRAAILSGRNPHSVHVGGHAAAATPTPGYDGRIPADKGSWAANMKAAGYATFAVGKWDHLPTADITPVGPYTYWPSGQGFDRFYGFLAAEADQWSPALIRDNSAIPAPRRPGYHLSADLADQAIAMIDGTAADAAQRPFFLYWATGIAHAPHHAPKEWIDRYKGKFDMGWDKARATILQRQIARGLVPAGTKLSPRPGDMPAWDSLGPDRKRLYARQMEVFAAALSYTDAQFGRILDALERDGKLDDTIIVVTTDNGAAAEGAYDGSHHEGLFPNGHLATVAENLPFIDKWGGPETFPTYSFGWAVAGNTPFRYYKQTTHEGGVHVPMVIAWPRGIKARGEVRTQFAYVADIAPTVMDLAKVPAAETINNVPQQPMEGLSFAYTLADPKAPDRKQAQYFELWGNKGLWSNGWTIVTSHRLHSWDMSVSTPITEQWELYDLRKDPGQTTDLAARDPAKVAELAALYDEQAKRYNVASTNAGDTIPYQIAQMKARLAARDGIWRYTGPVSQVAEGAGPPIQSMPFRASFGIDLPSGGETGPIFALGGKLGGMGLYLKAGVPTFTLRGFDGSARTVAGDAPLPQGASTLELTLDRPVARPLTPQDIAITIKANGRTLASGTVRYAMAARYGVSQTFDIGNDFGDSVSDDYLPGVPFAGTITSAEFRMTPP